MDANFLFEDDFLEAIGLCLVGIALIIKKILLISRSL